MTKTKPVLVFPTQLERSTLMYWIVSKTFYNPQESEALTVSTGLQMTNGVIGNVSSRKKVWRRTAALQDDIICNNKDAK